MIYFDKNNKLKILSGKNPAILWEGSQQNSVINTDNVYVRFVPKFHGSWGSDIEAATTSGNIHSINRHEIVVEIDDYQGTLPENGIYDVRVEYFSGQRYDEGKNRIMLNNFRPLPDKEPDDQKEEEEKPKKQRIYWLSWVFLISVGIFIVVFISSLVVTVVTKYLIWMICIGLLYTIAGVLFILTKSLPGIDKNRIKHELPLWWIKSTTNDNKKESEEDSYNNWHDNFNQEQKEDGINQIDQETDDTTTAIDYKDDALEYIQPTIKPKEIIKPVIDVNSFVWKKIPAKISLANENDITTTDWPTNEPISRSFRISMVISENKNTQRKRNRILAVVLPLILILGVILFYAISNANGQYDAYYQAPDIFIGLVLSVIMIGIGVQVYNSNNPIVYKGNITDESIITNKTIIEPILLHISLEEAEKLRSDFGSRWWIDTIKADNYNEEVCLVFTNQSEFVEKCQYLKIKESSLIWRRIQHQEFGNVILYSRK